MTELSDYESELGYLGPHDPTIENSAMTIASILRVNEQIFSRGVNKHYQYTHDPVTGNLLVMFTIVQDRLLTHHDEYFILEDVPGDNVHVHLMDTVISNPSASANRIIQRLAKLIDEEDYVPEVSNFQGDYITNKLLPR